MRGEEALEEAHRKLPPSSLQGARKAVSTATISSGACSATQWLMPGPSGVGSRVEVELMTISFHNLKAFGLGDAAKPARLAGRPLSRGAAS
jgi:hypothetical protein